MLENTIPEQLDLRDVLQSAPLGIYHFRLAILLALILWFDGYSLYNASYIIHDVAPLWQLSPSQIGLMLSCGLAGFAVGSAISGLFGDRFGRRKVILPGLWAGGIMSVAIGFFSHDLFSFVVLRFIMGIAIGVLMPLVITYINEIAPKHSANVFTIVFFSLGWIGGATCTGFIATWLIPRYGWQSLYFVGGLSLVLALILQFILPESVFFLASRNRWDEARNQLIRFWPERAEAFLKTKLVALEPTIKAGSIRALLTAKYRRQTLCFWIMGMFSLLSSYGLSGWLPTILLKRGENLSMSFAYSSLLVFSSAFGSLLTGFVADRIGNRRLAMSVGWLLGASAIAVLADSTLPSLTFWIIVVAGMFVIGTQTVLNNLVAVSYPTKIRSTGVGVYLGIGRVGAMLGPAIAGVLQQATGGTGAMFFILSIVLIIAAALVFLVDRPENRLDVVGFEH